MELCVGGVLMNALRCRTLGASHPRASHPRGVTLLPPPLGVLHPGGVQSWIFGTCFESRSLDAIK